MNHGKAQVFLFEDYMAARKAEARKRRYVKVALRIAENPLTWVWASLVVFAGICYGAWKLYQFLEAL